MSFPSFYFFTCRNAHLTCHLHFPIVFQNFMTLICIYGTYVCTYIIPITHIHMSLQELSHVVAPLSYSFLFSVLIKFCLAGEMQNAGNSSSPSTSTPFAISHLLPQPYSISIFMFSPHCRSPFHFVAY